jgi:hypothetical protein
MMVKNTPQPIDLLIREVYTRYNLARTPTGYFYLIDTTYQGNGPFSPNNVISQQLSLSNNLIVDLYQINAL